MEKELEKEKAEEDFIESKIRTLRKNRCKARLSRDTHPSKRQKTSPGNYVSIRKVWSRPECEKPGKDREKERRISVEEPKEKKMRREISSGGEILTNIKRIEDKILQEDVTVPEDWGWVDWNEKFEEQRKQLEKVCLLYTSPSPRDGLLSRMPSSA